MEKNIKERVWWLAAVLYPVLVVLCGYWFFWSPRGYWQKRKEAEREEYTEKRLLWWKSEKMTVQQMLSDMTLLAQGDSVMVCWLTSLPLPVYRDFIHGAAQPKRRAWAETRYWYMSSMANGREWMQQITKDRKYKAIAFYSTVRDRIQKDSTKDYRKEKLTPMEAICNKVYPAFGKSADKEFEEWKIEHRGWLNWFCLPW